MKRHKASDFDPELLYLYDDYAHGRLGRREFLEQASRFAVAGMTAETLLASLSPNYAWAQQVPRSDPRIEAEYVTYASPQGAGTMRGYLVQPKHGHAPWPGVLVIHENRGLNPYIEDVTRRLAVEGFLAFAPDALTPFGGYPGNDDKGRELQQRRDRQEMTEDFVAAARFLRGLDRCNGDIGVVGFCFGGGMANTLAVRLPEVIRAAVPFYGSQPAVEDVRQIRAALLLHYAERDPRINAGWPAYEKALRDAQIPYTAYHYDGVSHGFHNDTTPRYDESAARLAWERTIAFLRQSLRASGDDAQGRQ